MYILGLLIKIKSKMAAPVNLAAIKPIPAPNTPKSRAKMQIAPTTRFITFDIMIDVMDAIKLLFALSIPVKILNNPKSGYDIAEQII